MRNEKSGKTHENEWKRIMIKMVRRREMRRARKKEVSSKRERKVRIEIFERRQAGKEGRNEQMGSEKEQRRKVEREVEAENGEK